MSQRTPKQLLRSRKFWGTIALLGSIAAAVATIAMVVQLQDVGYLGSFAIAALGGFVACVVVALELTDTPKLVAVGFLLVAAGFTVYGAVEVGGQSFNELLDNEGLLDCSFVRGRALEQCVDALTREKFNQPIVDATWAIVYSVGVGVAAFAAAFGKFFGDPA